jgi:TP901 family phage tail tape measure protein
MSLEASELTVRVRLLGGAAFKTEAAGVERSVAGIGAAGKKADLAPGLNRSAGALTNLSNKMSKVGSTMISTGKTLSMAGAGVGMLGYYAIKASASFGQSMTLLVTQAGLPMPALKALSAQVEAMAPAFGATPLSLAQGLYPIESVGLRGTAAMDALKASAMGNAVGLDSLANTSDAVSTIMASHIRGAGGPVEAMAIMDKSIGLGKLHLADLTDSFKSGIIPISQQFGLSFKQILATMSGLTRVGIPANVVMSRMRLTLTSMVSPTSMGQKALAKMGMTQYQLADDLRSPGGLLTAIQDLKSHAAALGNTDLSNSYIAQIFGKSRGISSIGGMLQQLDQIKGIYAQVMGTTPATLYQHFDQTKATAAFKYKQIHAALDTAMIKLGDAINKYLLPALAKLVPIVTGVVGWFGQLSTNVKRFILLLAVATVAGGPILMFTGALVSTVGKLMMAVAWIGRLGVASEAAAGASAAGGLTGFGAGLARVIPALGLLAVAAYAAYKIWNLPIMKHVGPAPWGKHQTGHMVPGSTRSWVVNPTPTGTRGFPPVLAGRVPYNIPGLAPFDPRGDGVGGPPIIGGSLPQWSGTLTGSGLPPAGSPGGVQLVTHTQINLDGKVLTQVVNTENRKIQNRR